MSTQTAPRATSTTAAQGSSSRSFPSPFGSGDGGFANLRQASADTSAAAAVEAEREIDPYAGMSAKERRAAVRAARRLKGTFGDHPHLAAMKPREGYVFRSDYFEVDGAVACVLGFFHDEASRDDFGAFWGINRIPAGLGDGVSVIVFEQTRRLGEKWITDKLNNSEKLNRLESGEQETSGTASSRRKAQKVSSDVEEVTGELQDGASYLHVHNRLLVKAPNLAALDEAIDKIDRLYVDRFGTLNVAAYPGEQRPELSGLFRRNEKKRGHGDYFTSIEFAGSHSLVTNGLNDAAGEFVGSMVGDVNNSAVLFDVNDFEHHVVVADATMNSRLGRVHLPDMWGSKASQSALLSNARVVHLVLDGADLNKLGPKLSGLTARLDMNSGDINMFEMFGSPDDELSIFPAHLEKVVLMAEQAYQSTDSDRSIIRGQLAETLKTFYVDKGMWFLNAKEQRSRLRLVGIPHRDVPRLQDLVIYFDTKYRELTNSTARDDEQLHAVNILKQTFRGLLDANADLFNTHTADAIDGVADARRVIYDFSQIQARGQGVAMAQLVNTVGFAVSSLGLGDLVVVHGTELIDDRVKDYITRQFKQLYARGGRVAFLYNEVELMLADADFNQFDKADWTVLGPMSETTVSAYQKKLGLDIPPDLERRITEKKRGQAYLRRGVTNVVFHVDLALGVNPARAAQRAAIEAQQAAARRSQQQPGQAIQPAPRAQQGQHQRPTMRPRSLPGPATSTTPAAGQQRMAPTR